MQEIKKGLTNAQRKKLETIRKQRIKLEKERQKILKFELDAMHRNEKDKMVLIKQELELTRKSMQILMGFD